MCIFCAKTSRVIVYKILGNHVVKRWGPGLDLYRIKIPGIYHGTLSITKDHGVPTAKSRNQAKQLGHISKKIYTHTHHTSDHLCVQGVLYD